MTYVYKEYEVRMKMVGSAGGEDFLHLPVGKKLSTCMKFNYLQMSSKKPTTLQYDLSFCTYVE